MLVPMGFSYYLAANATITPLSRINSLYTSYITNMTQLYEYLLQDYPPIVSIYIPRIGMIKPRTKVYP